MTLTKQDSFLNIAAQVIPRQRITANIRVAVTLLGIGGGSLERISGYEPPECRIILSCSHLDCAGGSVGIALVLSGVAGPETRARKRTNSIPVDNFPKKHDFTTITDYEIAEAVHRLNHHPRKKLGFKTPYEVFFKTSTLLTVALQS